MLDKNKRNKMKFHYKHNTSKRGFYEEYYHKHLLERSLNNTCNRTSLYRDQIGREFSYHCLIRIIGLYSTRQTTDTNNIQNLPTSYLRKSKLSCSTNLVPDMLTPVFIICLNWKSGLLCSQRGFNCIFRF